MVIGCVMLFVAGIPCLFIVTIIGAICLILAFITVFYIGKTNTSISELDENYKKGKASICKKFDSVQDKSEQVLRATCAEIVDYYEQFHEMDSKAEELLNDVYRLDFEHDGQLEIKRLLAWTLLCLGRYGQSLSIYKKILRSDYGDATENDMLCLVDLYWAWGDVKSSVETMVRYRDQYLTGMSEENVCARLWEKMEDEGRHLSPYCPCFMDGIELLIDCVAFQRSLSSTDG